MSMGIFKPILDSIAKQTPKIIHNFAYTAFVYSVWPDIVEEAKRFIDGNSVICNKIENCVRRLLSHDVDGVLDEEVDTKVDQFWDELKHLHNQ